MGLISNGSTIFDNGSMASGFGGSLVFLAKQSITSPVSSVEFVDGSGGVDFTSYKEYIFYFLNLHPNSNTEPYVSMNFSTDGGSNYNVTKTTTSVYAFQDEAGGSTGLGYHTPTDLAQSTAFQQLNNTGGIGNDNDQSLSGTLQIFNPSSATFVKHFIACTNQYQNANNTIEAFIAGYGNTTNSVDAVRFQMSSGNIDSGKIKLYGIKDS